MTSEEKMIADPVLRTVLEKYKDKKAPQELIDKMGIQTEKGIAEYGQTIGFSSLSVDEMFNYLLEELVDVPIYLVAFHKLLNESHFMKLARENEKLIKTVRFYAQQGNWVFRDDERIFSPSEVEMDKGHLARKTLEGLGYEFENKS